MYEIFLIGIFFLVYRESIKEIFSNDIKETIIKEVIKTLVAEKKIMIKKFDKKVDRNIFNKGYFPFSPTKINKMDFYFEIVHTPFYIQATEIKFFKVSHSYKSYSYNLVSSGILLKIKSTDEFKVEDINIKDIFPATSKTYYGGDFLYIHSLFFKK